MTFNSETTNGKMSSPFSEPSESSQPDQTTIQSCLPATKYDRTQRRLHSKPFSLLGVAATGLGKTEVFAAVAKHWPHGRVMMISHRFELNQQAQRRFQQRTGLDVDFEQAEYRANERYWKSPIVVASVQTLASKNRRTGEYRMQKFDPADFGLLIIDEAHRSLAPSYIQIIKYFEQNPNLRVLGVTATPDRLDRKGMHNVYDGIAFNRGIDWGIANGWLVPVRQCFVRIDTLDLSKVEIANTTEYGKDLNQKQLAKALELEANLHGFAKPIADLLEPDRQGLVFTASVKQAERMTQLIRDYRAKLTDRAPLVIESLDQGTPKDKRQALIAEFKAGTVHAICNVGVLTEGFDSWRAKIIAMAAPTKSRAKYTQCLGRGTRPKEGIIDDRSLLTAEARIQAIAASEKDHLLVLDFVGNSARHDLVCAADILGGKVLGALPTEEQKAVLALFKELSKTMYDRDAMDVLLAAQDQIRAERELARLKVTAHVEYTLEETRSLYKTSEFPKLKVPGYLHHIPPSDGQKKIMRKLGFSDEQTADLNKVSAKLLINWAKKNPRNEFGRWLSKQPDRMPDTRKPAPVSVVHKSLFEEVNKRLLEGR